MSIPQNRSPGQQNRPQRSPDQQNRSQRSPDQQNRSQRSPDQQNRSQRSPDQQNRPQRSPDQQFHYYPNQNGQQNQNSPQSQNSPHSQNRQQNQNSQQTQNRPPNQHGSKQNFRPKIHLNYSLDQIKLSEEQKARIAVLDAKIKELKKSEKPDKTQHDLRIKKFDEESSKLSEERNKIENQIRNIEENKRKFGQKEQPQIQVLSKKTQERSQVIVQLHEKIQARKKTSKKRSELINERKDKTAKLPARSVEDANQKISEIEETLETESLSLNQMKAKMTQKEKIEQCREILEGMDELQKKIEILKQEDDQLSKEIAELNAQKTTLEQEIEKLNSQSTPSQEKMTEYSDKIRELHEEEGKLSEEMEKIYLEKQKLREDFQKDNSRFYQDNQASYDLKYEMDGIYQTAERIMIQIAETEKQISGIKAHVNPNQSKIDNCKVLINYLENILLSEKDTTEDNQTNLPKITMKGEKGKAAAELIAQLRGPGKKKKGGAKKKQTAITHTIEAYAQFSKLDLPVPTKIDEVSDSLATLQERVRQLENSYVPIELKFVYLRDGKIEVHLESH